ncbi:MAG: 4Fe-4S ferredoxin [bacterium]|nr:4Fe-4S ferredoxin [bacterium]
MLIKTGVPQGTDLEKVYPSSERLKKGGVAVIECFQNIPCNPCATSCPRGAIEPFADINDLPIIDHDACNGCAICVANCPGLAVFVIDESFSSTETLVKMPYEFAPLPKVGATVSALNRAGEVIGEAKVVRVQMPISFDRTAVVHVVVPKELGQEARFIKVVPDHVR